MSKSAGAPLLGMLVGCLVGVVAHVQPASAQADVSNWLSNVFGNTHGFRNANTERDRITELQARRAENARLDNMIRTTTPWLNRETIAATEMAIDRYRQIVAAGGWRTIPRTKGAAWMREGARDERVALLRRRLAMTGDWRGRDVTSWGMDATLAEALRRFQMRHGLRPNGVVDSRTLAALNVPAQERLNTLQVNLVRIRTFAARVAEAERYVVVNSPSFELQAVANNVVELRKKTIVGRAATQTPTIEAEIKELNFLPYWRVPDSIARRDLIPAIIKDPDYLKREGIRVLTGWGGEELNPDFIDWRSEQARNVKFRQDPGPRNALGVVRVNMPNDQIVYLHDTPMKPLFNRGFRAFSAGCVRVEEVLDLAEWLARDTEEPWSRARMEAMIASGVGEDIKLPKRVPVLFIYLTGWAKGAGEAQFRADIYQRDGTTQLLA
ncbi:MAG: L,D-transpeptidase family protein, partial [Pseudomonadota bacterium]